MAWGGELDLELGVRFSVRTGKNAAQTLNKLSLQCSGSFARKRSKAGGEIGAVFLIGAKCCSSGEDCPTPVHQWGGPSVQISHSGEIEKD